MFNVLNFLAKPTIDGNSGDESIVIFEGEDYSIDCKGHGIPEPNVEWILKGKSLPTYSGIGILN